MRTASLPRLLAIGSAILVLVGCAAASPSTTQPTPSRSAAPSASGSGSGPATWPSTPGALPGAMDDAARAWVLVGRRGQADLQLVLATTGEIGFDLPSGTPRENWERILTTTPDGGTTIVRDLVVQPGFGGPELRIPGSWQLPTVGLDPIPAGRSLDGSTIALVEGAYAPSAARTRFAIVEHHLLGKPSRVGDTPLRLARVVELLGAFEYDALSPDGRILYVVQHLDEQHGGRYQVRAVDVPTGVMRDGVIFDKANPDERMAGTPIAQVRRPDGLVLTLYRGPEHPFIHALMSADAWAVCIDLPAPAGGDASDDAALDWGLTASSNGGSVYAVNASLGLVVDVDPSGLAVRRSASIDTTAAAAPSIVLAKFGHTDVGQVGRRVVASPDGSLLFAAGPDGVLAIRTTDLTVARRDLAGSAVDALGITPDGKVLFALAGGSGEVVALDAQTGHRFGTVPGSGYDRLLAVAPW